jgi:hypothetical protein
MMKLSLRAIEALFRNPALKGGHAAAKRDFVDLVLGEALVVAFGEIIESLEHFRLDIAQGFDDAIFQVL